jgi:hypothetical protein
MSRSLPTIDEVAMREREKNRSGLMRAVRRIVFVLAVVMVAAPVGAGGAGAAQQDFKPLRYYDYPASHMFVATDGSWSNAHVVPVPAALHPPDAGRSLWQARRAQRVHLDRELLGRATVRLI